LADIRPFHGTHYNPAQVADLTAAICPPYDIITPAMQQQLYEASEYNFVRIEHGREFPQDSEADNKYTRAAAALAGWLAEGVLKTDARPALYVEDHSFTYRGRQYRRRNLNCLVRLEEWDKGIVRPHEVTVSRAKGDRLDLLWALGANTSPIMTLYEDKKGEIAAGLAAAARGEPLFNITGKDSEGHRLRAVTDGETIRRISDCLVDRPLYIADGHHRYESALTYRRERRACDDSPAGSQPYDFVMMNLVDFADPGLVILPAHRLVRGLPRPALEGLLASLPDCFAVAEVPLDKANPAPQIEGLLGGAAGEVRLAVCGLREGQIVTLTLRDFEAVAAMFPAFHSPLYRRLDVSIVDHVLLEELLGLTHEMAGACLDYTHDINYAVRTVSAREYQLAFIVNPVKTPVIKAIADSGERMPRKSTYFFPKIPSGLLLYRFA